MAYIEGHQHDVFVSYAHLDDRPYIEGEPGWVSKLKNLLENRVSQMLGEKADIWMDYRLQGNDAVTPAITEALSSSALLLFVVSKSYSKSPWCNQELTEFLRTSVNDRRLGPHTCLFMVHSMPVDRLSLPEALQELRAYHFWKHVEGGAPITLGYPKVSADQDQYWETLNQLAVEIVATLESLKNREVVKKDKGKTVLLAEVTEDLEPRRQEVERYLRQAGLRVLPQAYYRRDELKNFQDAVDSDLGEADLFVQLLSGIVGRKPPELPQGFPGLQYQRARAAKKPILQWRVEGVKVAEADAEHQKVLNAKTVIVEGLQAFKERVVKRAFAPPPTPAAVRQQLQGPPPQPKRIFVNTESGDRAIAQKIANCIMAKGLSYTLSRETSIRKDLTKRLRECDGAIIVYASSPAKWVEQQQKYVKRVLMKLKPPIPLIRIGRFERDRPPNDFLNELEFGTILFGEDVDCAALDGFLHELVQYDKNPLKNDGLDADWDDDPAEEED